MDEMERENAGIYTLPGSLIEAIHEIEKSDLAKKALGEHIFSKFIENKEGRVGQLPHPGQPVRARNLFPDALTWNTCLTDITSSGVRG